MDELDNASCCGIKSYSDSFQTWLYKNGCPDWCSCSLPSDRYEYIGRHCYI